MDSALEKLTMRMNEMIDCLKELNFDEVVVIKKMMNQNNTIEGNVYFNEWVTNGLKGELSSKDDKTFDESIRQGHATLYGWLVSALKAGPCIIEKLQ